MFSTGLTTVRSSADFVVDGRDNDRCTSSGNKTDLEVSKNGRKTGLMLGIHNKKASERLCFYVYQAGGLGETIEETSTRKEQLEELHHGTHYLHEDSLQGVL